MASQQASAGGAPLRLRPLSSRAANHPIAGVVRFLGRRLLSSLVTLLGISTVTFVIVRLLGNPVYLLVGQDSNQQIIDEMTRAIGLDQPIWVQYAVPRSSGARRLRDLSSDVSADHRDTGAALPATVELVLAAMLIVVCLAIPMGIAAAARQGSAIDKLSQI